MPLWRDWEDLSSEAVDRRVERVLTSDVLPESTWPSTPMLRLRTRDGSNLEMSLGVIVPWREDGNADDGDEDDGDVDVEDGLGVPLLVLLLLVLMVTDYSCVFFVNCGLID